MATVDLAATALETVDSWEMINSSDPVAIINSNDGSVTFFRVWEFDQPSSLLFHYQDLPSDAVAVNILTQYASLGRLASGGNSIYNWTHKYSSVQYHVGNTTFPPSWTTYSSVITFGGGGGWTVEGVNNSVFGIRFATANLNLVYYYESYHKVIVDYVVSGMFVITFVLPLLGIISTSFDRLMRQLLPQVRYTREELEKIRQDIRNSQRGYSFPLRAR